MSNKKAAIELIDQMIERAEREDAENCKKNLKNNKASQTVGQGWWPFHLKTLKSLVQSENEWYSM